MWRMMLVTSFTRSMPRSWMPWIMVCPKEGDGYLWWPSKRILWWKHFAGQTNAHWLASKQSWTLWRVVDDPWITIVDYLEKQFTSIHYLFRMVIQLQCLAPSMSLVISNSFIQDLCPNTPRRCWRLGTAKLKPWVAIQNLKFGWLTLAHPWSFRTSPPRLPHPPWPRRGLVAAVSGWQSWTAVYFPKILGFNLSLKAPDILNHPNHITLDPWECRCWWCTCWMIG